MEVEINVTQRIFRQGSVRHTNSCHFTMIASKTANDSCAPPDLPDPRDKARIFRPECAANGPSLSR